jgi:Fe-S cluster biogenesis protein NfuA
VPYRITIQKMKDLIFEHICDFVKLETQPQLADHKGDFTQIKAEKTVKICD